MGKSPEQTQMASNHKKRCSASCIIGELQVNNELPLQGF